MKFHSKISMSWSSIASFHRLRLITLPIIGIAVTLRPAVESLSDDLNGACDQFGLERSIDDRASRRTEASIGNRCTSSRSTLELARSAHMHPSYRSDSKGGSESIDFSVMTGGYFLEFLGLFAHCARSRSSSVGRRGAFSVST